ncbi:MAG: cyclodeaminase/cyclohydrolase family protein [Thermoplasmata archaeon]|nr:cyclodeaminase/cyclohydrolase family protein [Thermoplasmata archaeon]
MPTGVPNSSGLSSISLDELLSRVAARTPTPGGGSVSAIVGALGVALAQMVLAYSAPAGSVAPALAELAQELAAARSRFTALAEEDAASFEAVRATRRAQREAPEDEAAARRWEGALRKATEVPTETARLALRLEQQLERHRGQTKSSVGSDLVSALALLRAAREGALANVRINLEELAQAGLPHADLQAEADRISGSDPPGA